MRYKILGNSGLRVSELCLGTMTFGEDWGWGASKEESRRIFDLYAEAGGNFIDTANRYTEGTSERYVGDFVSGDRDRWVIATKYTLRGELGDPNAAGNHRKNLVRSLEGSLRRLNTDYVDLLWIHAWDFLTPVEEIMRSLDDQVRAGKVLYIGVSDAPAWAVAQADTLARLRGWTPFAALQIEYSLIQRDVERELLPMARALGMAVTPWGVLGGGALSGKYLDIPAGKSGESRRLDRQPESTRVSRRSLEIAREVRVLAEELGRSPVQVALAWVRGAGDVPMIPIIGARRAEQLKDCLGCLDFVLGAQYRERLDEVSGIKLGFPHDFVAARGIRELIYAGTYDLIDKP